jgi:hypothetical protein
MKKAQQIKVTFKRVEASDEEVQARIGKVFEMLFEEVLRRRREKRDNAKKN